MRNAGLEEAQAGIKIAGRNINNLRYADDSNLTAESSVQFSHSKVSDSLRPHESQHARPPGPSPTPGVHSDSHPYTTNEKTIALTRQTFVIKVVSLLFNMLSRLGYSFSSKEQPSFNFMAAITICSDFGAPPK